MKNSTQETNNQKTSKILWVAIAFYIVYFCVLSVQRYRTLYASYFDLGIMHQTVYNTFRAMQTLDGSRILEMTNVFGPDQIKRMAIHNDVLLAFLAPFYAISSTPETLLIIQSVVLGLGAWIIYKISQLVFHDKKYQRHASLMFSVGWLLYPPLQRSNLFDFHAVVLSTTLLAGLYYFWRIRKYALAGTVFILSILSKEQVALTTGFFGLYTLYTCIAPPRLLLNPWRNRRKIIELVGKDRQRYVFGISVIAVSALWFLLSFFVIIPGFRGGHHFATERYGQLGESPAQIIQTVFTNPQAVMQQIAKGNPIEYLWHILGPLGLLSLFSPLQLLLAAPEFAINLLSNEPSMRNIFFHYTAVLTPFIFISAMYGFKNVETYLHHRVLGRKSAPILLGYLGAMIIAFSYTMGPLFFAKTREIHPFAYPQKEAAYVHSWAKILQDESIKVAATGQVAPHFASRRYLYTFSKYYPFADYVIVRPSEVYNNWEKGVHIPAYEQLVRDARFKLIEKRENFEVYKKKQ